MRPVPPLERQIRGEQIVVPVYEGRQDGQAVQIDGDLGRGRTCYDAADALIGDLHADRTLVIPGNPSVCDLPLRVRHSFLLSDAWVVEIDRSLEKTASESTQCESLRNKLTATEGCLFRKQAALKHRHRIAKGVEHLDAMSYGVFAGQFMIRDERTVDR